MSEELGCGCVGQCECGTEPVEPQILGTKQRPSIPEDEVAPNPLLNELRWRKDEPGKVRMAPRLEKVEPKRGRVLLDALDVINGERQDQYGSPEDSFALIAEYWSVYLFGVKKAAALELLDAPDVAAMMVLFKLARQANQHKRDNLLDAAGYLGIWADMEEK